MPVEIEKLTSVIAVEGEAAADPAEVMRLARLVARVLADEAAAAGRQREATQIRDGAARSGVSSE
jgi:hypothetical protein